MDSALLQAVLGGAIFSILFSLGIGLSMADFRRVVAQPKAFSVSLACQLVLLPLLAIAVAKVFALSPHNAVGLLLLSACPGGVTSNAFTRLAGGAIALSVSLTAASSLLAVISIPTILFIGQQLLGADAQVVTIPLDYLAKNLLVITFLPVVLGMLVKQFAPRAALWLEPKLFPATTTLFFLIIAALWYLQFDIYRDAFIEAGLPTFVLFMATVVASLIVARLAKFEPKDRTAAIFEVGVQNPPVAFFIAVNIMKDMAVVPPAAVYAVVMVVGAAVMVLCVRAFAD
ncbi:MAG: bile acid:sodium symporter family protein [Halioglobus sp.]